MTGIIGAMVEAWDEIRIHRLRVILSLLTVGVAIAIMTGTVALGQQMAQATQEMTEKWSGRATTLTVMAWPSDWEKVDELADAIQDFTVNHEIEYASREAWGYGQFSTLAGTLDMQMTIVDPDYAVIHRLDVTTGSWFGPGDVQRLAPAVVVNEAFFTQLGLPSDLSVQPELRMISGGPQELTNQSFVVIGVLPSQSEWDMPTAYVLYDALSPIVGEQMSNYYSGSTKMWIPPADEGTATQALRAELQPLVGEMGSLDIQSSSMMGGFGGEMDFNAGTRQIIFWIGVAVLALGGISLINVQLVTVQQRVREIGIRRSFGATSGRVFVAIMLESVVGTLLAGLIGVAAAIMILDYFPIMSMMNMPVTEVPPFPMGIALGGVVAATAIGAVAGILPGIYATRIRPIEAMRT